jgi:hypothetical protein
VIKCVDEAAAAYDTGVAATLDYTIIAAMDGKIYTSGKYVAASGLLTLAVGGKLILDGQNLTTSQWIFQCSSGVDIGVGSSITLKNDGLPNNVYWLLGTGLNTGVDSYFVGTVIAKTSVVWGVRTHFEGRAMALTSITFYDNITAIIPPIAPTSNPTSQPSTQPTSIPTRPSGQPTRQPTGQPSSKPSSQPM